MKTFFQVLLGLLSIVVGFFGGWWAYLWGQNMNYWWVMLLALALLGTAVGVNARRSHSRWLSVIAIGYGCGVALITLGISYGRAEETFGFTILTALVAGMTAHLARDRRPKTILRIWIFAFAMGIAALSTDHLILNGRLFAWKWRVIEQPVFGPGGFIKVEQHGRHVIYATDTGFTDPCKEAIVWGWHVFPRIVYLGDKLPEGDLINEPKIQEALR